MENSKEYVFVNLSDKSKVEKKNYDNMPYDNFPASYKPKFAFWGARESKDKKHYSMYDEMYEVSEEESIIAANYFKYGSDTAILSSANFNDEAKDALFAFYKMIDNPTFDGKLKTDTDTRKLLLEFLKDKGVVDRNVKHLIYQIDLIEDEDLIEEICGYTGPESSDEAVEHLSENFVKAMRRGFSGMEVTDFALGVSEEDPGFGIEEVEEEKWARDDRYEDCGLGAWDVYSVAIFDMDAIDLVRTIQINKRVNDNKIPDGDERN